MDPQQNYGRSYNMNASPNGSIECCFVISIFTSRKWENIKFDAHNATLDWHESKGLHDEGEAICLFIYKLLWRYIILAASLINLCLNIPKMKVMRTQKTSETFMFMTRLHFVWWSDVQHQLNKAKLLWGRSGKRRSKLISVHEQKCG